MMVPRPPTDAERSAAATELLRRRRVLDAQAVWRTDFLAFVGHLDIIDKDGQRTKLRPNAIQSAFEVSRSADGRDIVLKPRQVGFTTWELARDIWYLLTHPDSKVVVVVQTDSDHKPLRETSEKIRIMFESLAAGGIQLDFRSQTVSEWVLGNASLRIIEAGASEAKASKQGRGLTIHRLHITELAFFEYAQETLNAMMECVPSAEHGSEITIESTANGAAGIFYERYQKAKAGNDWQSHFFEWMQQEEYRTALTPGEVIKPSTEREQNLIAQHGASLEQLKWYRSKVEDKGQPLVDQEYPIDEDTCWLIAGRTFFDRAKVIALKGRTQKPASVALGGNLRIWAEAKPKRRYLIAADPSEGTGGDPGAAVVYDRESGEHVATLHGQFPPWRMGELLAQLGTRYNTAVLVVERNNHGHAVLQALLMPPAESGRTRYPAVYKSRDDKYGWHTNEITRTAALDAFESACRKGEWSSPDATVVAEMLVFKVNAKGKAEAAKGAHDDLVIASAIGWSVLRLAAPKQSWDLSLIPDSI